MKFLLQKIRFGDFAILFLILAVSVFLIIKNSSKKTGIVKIQAENETYIYDLSEDAIYTVKGVLGKTTVEVKNGRVRITESPCANKTCISQNWGTTLVCLPNKVFVTIENDEGEFDAIAK